MSSTPTQENTKVEGSQEPIVEASPSEEDIKKWGTHVMGAPAAPSAHPDNQKAALWNASDHQQIYELPYVVYSPAERPSHNPFEPVINMFNTWSRKTESIARNIWHNQGGFESLFKQIFATDPDERLKKTFACYLSTTTGPVAGTLYLSTARVAFCSDRPLSFTAPSGQETWSYYKVMIPLANVGSVNPVVMKENPVESYIQVVTVDGHDFWFMGFVNFEKASFHLLNSLQDTKPLP
ncbi:hypothetical protein V6Z12_A03G176300 [Gossypium hirsutum]